MLREDFKVERFNLKIRNLQPEHQYIDMFCQICLSDYKFFNNEGLRPPNICYDCWLNHVRVNITKMSYNVGSDVMSPFEEGQDMDICIVLNGLRSPHKQELEEWLFKKYTTFTTDIEKCPSETCDFVFTSEKCKWSLGKQNDECPKCQTPLSVQSDFSLKSFIGLIYFVFLANKCPKCDIPIERISGCPHMTCPCGHQFCWFCLKDYYNTKNNVYDVHEPKECAFIFVSKVLILTSIILSLSCFLVGGQTLRWIIEFFFVILGWLTHTVLLDLYVVAHVFVINLYQKYPYRNFPLQHSSLAVRLGALILFNFVVLNLLSWCDLLYHTIWIGIIEILMVSVGFGFGIGVIFICETWFEYIG